MISILNKGVVTMDPIKVDFSGGGSKKGKSVVIPPNKAGLKIAINLIVTAIVAAAPFSL